jgi:hypothetical protein
MITKDDSFSQYLKKADATSALIANSGKRRVRDAVDRHRRRKEARNDSTE